MHLNHRNVTCGLILQGAYCVECARVITGRQVGEELAEVGNLS
jgi:hypothetical protein